MKNYTFSHYELRHINNNGGLVCEFKTIEEAIKEREETAQRQINSGYRPDHFIVVLVMIQRVFDENGDFLGETTSVSKVC